MIHILFRLKNGLALNAMVMSRKCFVDESHQINDVKYGKYNGCNLC